MHRQPEGSQADFSSWGGLGTHWTCVSCCPSWGCCQVLDMAHLCVVMDKGSSSHGPPVIAGCHNQRHISPCLCHADCQLNGGLGGWGGGKGVRGAPGGAHMAPALPPGCPHRHSHSQPEPASSRRSLGRARRTQLTTSTLSWEVRYGYSPLEPSATSPGTQMWGGQSSVTGEGCQESQVPPLLSLPSLLLAARQNSTAYSVPSPAYVLAVPASWSEERRLWRTSL